MNTTTLQAALAAHRFGLGEPQLSAVGNDPAGWLLAQIGPAQAQRGDDLASGVEGLKRYAQFIQRLRAAAPGDAASATGAAAEPAALRATVQADVRARLATAALSTRPFNERLALFWANHFTVSMAKAGARGIVGAYEREALRPHIAGTFGTLLQQAVTHAGMLRYLDNDQSAGPDSVVVQRQARRQRTPDMPGPRITGLNENLAREILELHTLGVDGGYTQADVTAFAAVLTGWRIPMRDLLSPGSGAAGTSRFDAAWHQPGPKTVLGRRYAEGPQALGQVLDDLAVHPATARFVSTKLARHFVADEPPPALVARLQERWQHTRGDLPAVYRALVESPLAWAPQPAKLKTPEEFVVSTARVLGLGEQPFVRVADGGTTALGQRVQSAPSPAGWPDRAEEWLGPDAVWKRVEWATRVAERVGRQVDARAVAQASLGMLLQEGTARQIERAADGPQAVALLLLSPEFQRR